MSFKVMLMEKAEAIRDAAVRKEFHDELYRTTPSPGCKLLTIERYLSGPDPDAPGNIPDGNYFYWVRKGSPVWMMKAAKFGWIKDTFREFGDADPQRLVSKSRSYRSAAARLCADPVWSGVGDGDDIDLENESGAAILLASGINEINSNWDGDFAASFASAYGHSGEFWREALQGKFTLAVSLMQGIQALAAIVVAGRSDLMAIADSTLAALSGAAEFGDVGATSGLALPKAVTTTTLTAAPGGIEGTMATPGFPVDYELARAADDGPVVAPGDKVGFDIGGDTAAAILDSMRNQLERVKSVSASHESTVARSLEETHESAVSSNDILRLWVRDHDYEYDFGTRDTTANTEQLRAAAEDSFPEAANGMHSARMTARMGSSNLDFTMNDTGKVDSAAQEPWESLGRTLVSAISINSTFLHFTGKTLRYYAVDLDVIDEETARGLYHDEMIIGIPRPPGHPPPIPPPIELPPPPFPPMRPWPMPMPTPTPPIGFHAGPAMPGEGTPASGQAHTAGPM